MERKRSSRRYAARQKTLGAKCKDYLRQFIAFMFSNVGIIGLVVGYTIAGAFVFQAIEGKQDTPGNLNVLNLRDETAERLWNLTCSLNVFEGSEKTWLETVDEEMLKYQMKVVDSIFLGYDGSEDNSTTREWPFAGAFLYSLTVITTIGYGNVTPITTWGKIATIFYAIAGMPLFLLYLSNIGDILARSFKWLYARCCLCRCCPKKRKRPPPGVATALRGLTPAPVDPSSLKRGHSDRGPSKGTSVNRLQGSLSMEDGVNIGRGRRELDGFGRKYNETQRGRNDDVFYDEFDERNFGLHGRDFDDDVYASQDVHLNRANARMMTNVFEKAGGEFRRAASIDQLNESRFDPRSGRLAAVVDDAEPRLARGGSEKLRRGLQRQEEVFEMTNVGSDKVRRWHDKDAGMSKAELVLGMNDLGLEYLDLPKKRGPLQRVFGKVEGPKAEVPRDSPRLDGYVHRGSAGAERAPYRQEVVPKPVEPITSDEESDDEGSSRGSGSSDDGEFDSQAVTVPVTLCLAIMVGYICGGAVLFSLWEDWDFLDGSYFCFISLSTIGFGDFVPGDQIIRANKVLELSFIFCAMYLMLGMALIAMCFNLMQEEVVHKMRSCASSLRNCMACAKRSVLPAR